MGLDPLSPIAPARLRALLLPVGKIKRSRFLSFAARLQAENVVRLGDISPDSRPNRNMFSPLAFPTGMIIYDLSISVPPTSHLELFPFEVFREPLVVIGIADGTELPGPSEISNGAPVIPPQESGTLKPPTPHGLEGLLEELKLVKEHNPRAQVHQLLVFDYHGLDKLVSGPEEVTWVPRPEASKATTIKTVLCDITSLLLGELDEFAKIMQSIPSIESPRASSWGPRRNPELRPRPVDKLLHRVTMPAQLPSTPNGAPDGHPASGRSSPASADHDSPTTFDEITRSIQLANRASSLGKPSSASSSKEHSRDRMSVQGLSATDRTKNRIKGRFGVVVGTLFLQAGRWPDALKELVEAASMARASSDYVWHGKALESILLCLLMFGWAGMDFQIPPICYPVADKSSSKASYYTASAPGIDTTTLGQAGPGNRIVSLQNLANLLPDLSNNILNLYNRAANITDEPLPQLVYSETVIRLARLQTAVRIRDGTLDDNALQHVVMNEPLVPVHNPERPVGATLLRKTDISNFLLRALPLSPGSELPATDSVPILVGIASVLGTLDLPRKKAFILRELLSVMVPSLVQARKIGAAEIGIHPAAGLSSLSDAAFDINALDMGPGNMESTVRTLLASIGETYGVQPSASHEFERHRRLSAMSNLEGNTEYDSVAAIVERSFRHVALNGYGDLDLKIDVLKASINFCEALPDFEGVLRFTVELLQTIRGDLMLPEYDRLTPSLSPEEQIRLLNNIKRTVGAARKLGAPNLEAEYWDDFLIRGVELLELPHFKRPIRRTKKDWNAATASSDRSKKDPFLYSPFSKPSSKASEPLLIAGEPASFKVTLQNPYEFDVEIESLRLDGEGVPLDAVAQGIWLPPLSIQEVILSGVAHDEGTLNVTGCIVKVQHCRQRKFPIFSKLWKPEPETKFKRTGLSAKKPVCERPFSWSSTTSIGGKLLSKKGPETSSCPITVIKKQPTVLVQSVSLSQSAIMVLEGETRSFEVTLQNTSSCPADFVLFTFQDSTTRQLQSALSNRDLLPAEIYELELQLLTKHPLRWRRKSADASDLSIPPGQSATFTVEVFGKPGLQDAIVQIDYCHVGTSSSDLPEVFYTRQMLLPITITVNASIEVARCDILPLSGDLAWSNIGDHKYDTDGDPSGTANGPLVSTSKKSDEQFPSLFSRLGLSEKASEHCLLLLDLRNAWPEPISVSLYSSEEPDRVPTDSNGDQAVVTGNLQPGQTSRFVLVIPRIFLDDPHASIPVLDTGLKRQFVVSANKLSFEAEAASREAFWYREDLLKRIFGLWREENSGRQGEIEFRNIRLSPRMVDAMRMEDVDISFSLSPINVGSGDGEQGGQANAIVRVGHAKYAVRTDDFLTLSVKVHNRSSRPIHPLLRVQPGLRNQPNAVALDLSRRMAWTGMLQRVLPIVKGGETAEATLSVTILTRGEYEFGASVEEVRVLKPLPRSAKSDQDGQTRRATFSEREDIIEDTFGVGVTKTRRIWHARETCVLSAHD
ncbi:hypothetical protein DTO164E3_4117 [Paecilomyces variotii]|nr:hypothetical protein DTO164E3_4117 [Paecilomyces variotii]KAJ9208345.1 hypothetical protein DTO032I3_1016 [Paecilomyces variotii]KAJ9282201.1 hypothetical protein DTO021D3_953 [Paecilomyces variotii]KAJ9338697.1 hypothetical protein DTO027B6_8770 [Paecilomyces variotii]KAJ9386581.1 hypothetical protein DTO032I4_3677 [Paecilomyces variotii]